MKHSLQLFLTIITLYLIFWNPATAQHWGWNWQNPIPQANDLFSVSFADAMHGTAVGAHGTILHTSNGGAS